MHAAQLDETRSARVAIANLRFDLQSFAAAGAAPTWVTPRAIARPISKAPPQATTAASRSSMPTPTAAIPAIARSTLARVG
jgi:hypothetical protein